jgi:hypothetical protein
MVIPRRLRNLGGASKKRYTKRLILTEKHRQLTTQVHSEFIEKGVGLNGLTPFHFDELHKKSTVKRNGGSVLADASLFSPIFKVAQYNH